MNLIKQVEEATNFKFSLSKKTKELVVKDTSNKVISEAVYSPFLRLLESNMNQPALKEQLVQTLINKKEHAAHLATLSYDEEYLRRQEIEPFVVTHIGSPNRGYKLSYYPSGHYKVGKTFQSIEVKKAQLGLAIKEESPKFETIYALEAYEPFSPDVIFMDSDKEDYYLNMYRPSIYMEVYKGYYPDISLLPYNTFDQLPSVVQAFFIHLLPCRKDREYLLQWLAWSIFEQCETIPILFGEEGTGKGTLNSLWARMLGLNNWSPMNASSLEGEFSMAHFMNKRGVSVNEGKITSEQQMENLKNSTDKYIRVNDKNEKFKTIKKTHSMIYTANHLDSIKVQGKGRRFSFLGVTDLPLPKAKVVLKNGEVVIFEEDNLNKINPPSEPEKLHAETFALFSFLANIYNNQQLDPKVKNTAHNNEEKTKKITEVSAPQWFTEIWEDIIVKCETHSDTPIEGFLYYILLGDIQLMYKSQPSRPKIVPGLEAIYKQFETRGKTHQDVKCKHGKSLRYCRVYLSTALSNELFEENK